MEIWHEKNSPKAVLIRKMTTVHLDPDGFLCPRFLYPKFFFSSAEFPLQLLPEFQIRC